MEITRTSYKTKQRNQLMEFIKTTSGKHFTVEDVKKYCAEKNISIATATIYRYLEKMLAEHILNKYVIDEQSAACFEYIENSEEEAENGHFHLKCEVCGKLIHLNCDELNLIKNHLLKEHGFSLDSFRTVFYGLCESCAAQKDKNKN